MINIIIPNDDENIEEEIPLIPEKQDEEIIIDTVIEKNVFFECDDNYNVFVVEENDQK